VCAHPSSLLGKAFGLAPIVWLGLRSYGIYLWHWPVLMLTRPNEDVPFDGAALIAFQLALMLGAAALSYQYVERPIRRHGLRGIRDALARWHASPHRPVRLAAPAGAVCLVALGVAV